MAKETACAFCGKESVYAKGLCRSCWSRYNRRGTAEYKYPPREPGVPCDSVLRRMKLSEQHREERIQKYHPTSTRGKEFLALYASGMTMQQIADRCGYSKQYVSLEINS